MKSPFHLMAKPTSYQCNLACSYCFYQGKTLGVLKDTQPTPYMSDEVLQQYIQKYIAINPAQEIEFSWQGGEPTMAGIDFYRRALELQRKFSLGKTITNTIQTNGVLINDDWALFFAENKFLVGISVDGPAYLYDSYRRSHSGKSVFHKVLNAVNLLKKYQVEFNILAVVNNETVKHPLEVYLFLTQELGAQFLQFIPVVEQTSLEDQTGELVAAQTNKQTRLTPWSISGEEWGSFTNTLFDYWVRHDVGRVFIQFFENMLAVWLGQPSAMCAMRSTCGMNLVIEQNGDIYSCDHYVFPEYKLGNVLTESLDKIVYSEKQFKFGTGKNKLSAECLNCEYGFVCQGGCPKQRIHWQGEQWHNHLCTGYKAIFQHVDPYMEYMVQQLWSGLDPASIMNNIDAVSGGQNN